jgi:hypothetical protein
MKLTKNTIKKLIKEEIAQEVLRVPDPERESAQREQWRQLGRVDAARVEYDFKTALSDAIEQINETIAKPLIGKRISGHESKGPVIKAYVYEPGYSPGLDLVVVFKKEPGHPVSIASEAGLT